MDGKVNDESRSDADNELKFTRTQNELFSPQLS